jgi:hypothetical protein
MVEQPTISIQRTSMLNSINFVGNTLNKVGIDPFQINANKVIKKAVKKSGFKEAIPKNIIEGLNKMVDSLNNDAKLNTFGKIAIKTLLERTLYGRLKVEQHFADHPEVEDIKIKEPIFIIGMPRTGTSILHALLDQDHYHRSPLAWECLLPFPPPSPSDYSTNAQFKTIEKEFEQLFRLVPDFRKKHYMEANSPQECLGINALDFNTFQISAQAYVPNYIDWFANEADKLGTMKFHKRFLQYLQSGGVKSERWLLKSPVHLLRLPEIFEVYPDAKVIMTHRHPNNIVPSASSLISSVRSLYSDSEEPNRTGQEQAETWSNYFERFVDIRKNLKKEHQIIDLKFDNFIEHPMEVLSMLYDQFQWELTEEVKQKFQVFLEANPKGKHGNHEYALKDFGLTESEIETKFEVYLKFLKKL